MNRGRHDGAALVELAMLLPVMLMLAFGIAELGRALYQHTSLGKATDLGARYMSRAWEAVTDECLQGPAWSTAVATAQNLVVHGNESGVGDPVIDGLSPGDVSVALDAGAVPGGDEPACVITVTSSVAFVGVFGEHIIPFTRLGPVQLSSEREVRYLGE